MTQQTFRGLGVCKDRLELQRAIDNKGRFSCCILYRESTSAQHETSTVSQASTIEGEACTYRYG